MKGGAGGDCRSQRDGVCRAAGGAGKGRLALCNLGLMQDGTDVGRWIGKKGKA